MKFKILPDSSLFASLWAIYQRGQECSQASREWIKDHFGEYKPYCIPPPNMYGGLLAIKLESKPKGWKPVGERHRMLFAPYANDKTINPEWEALPVVKKSEVKDLIQYHEYAIGLGTGKNRLLTFPGMVFNPDFILIDAGEGFDQDDMYHPVTGMIEILNSEYFKLKESILQPQK